MKHQDFPTVLTPEDVAKHLGVEASDVIAECEAQRLKGVRLGDKWRITAAALVAFLGGATSVTVNPGPIGSWVPCPVFKYKWPDGDVESYTDAFSADVALAGGNRHFIIGYGYRKAAGARRRRVVVFIGRVPQIVPLVEFVGTNDHDDTKKVVSVIKRRDDHHVRSTAELPPEYTDMPTVIYSDVVIGPHAPRSIAVFVREDERDVMLRHGIIRAQFKGIL